MSTFRFADAAADANLIDVFDPLGDILLFDAPAIAIRVSLTESSITFSQAGIGSVTLQVNPKTLTSGQGGAIRFSDSSELLIGDATPSTVSDDLANQLNQFATNNGDQMLGLGGNDTLNGGLGDDLLYGNAGADFIYGNATGGHDTVYGGQGNDVIDYYAAVTAYGNLGDDVIYGASNAADVLYGGQGQDLIYGNGGDDRIYGNADNDRIGGDDGADSISGGQGNDTIWSGFDDAADVLYGNLGDDFLVSNATGLTGDTLIGGQGNDTLQATGRVRMLGNLGDDRFEVLGTSVAVTVTGDDGNDTLAVDLDLADTITQTDFTSVDVLAISGASAVDFIDHAVGGAISNSLTRANLLAGADIRLITDNSMLILSKAAGQTLSANNLVLSDGSVFAYNVGGAAGSFAGGANNDALIAGENGDTLTAGAGIDSLFGGQGSDLFDIGALTGLDSLDGGDGVDRLIASVTAGTSADQTLHGLENVSLSWTGAQGTANVTLTQDQGLSVDATSLGAGQNLDINAAAVAGNVTLATGRGQDTLTGGDNSDAQDSLSGGDGNDLLKGLAGRDSLNGQAGADSMIGGVDADTMTGGVGADQFIFFAGDSAFTLSGVDHITDFAAGEDKIVFTGPVQILADLRVQDFSGAANLATAAETAYNASGTSSLADAVVFNFGGATYLLVHQQDSAFSTSNDLLVDITGFSGTLSASDIM